MSEKSAIEWTDATWNPVTGCTKVSPGCANCYMFREYPKLAKRGAKGYAGGTPDQVRCWPERLNDPLKWRRPRRIFVCSMSDLFHEAVWDDFIHQVLVVCVLAVRQGHTIIILTKRPERMSTFSRYIIDLFHDVHCDEERLCWGVSVERQKEADERIPFLLRMNVRRGKRVVSYEPALGPLDFDSISIGNGNYYDLGYSNGPGLFDRQGRRIGDAKLDWVIAGGESGPNARPSHPDWFRSVRDQCQAAGVPFFFKQWGEWSPPETFGCKVCKIEEKFTTVGIEGFSKRIPIGTRLHSWADGKFSAHVGRRRAGRMLDGQEWNEYPK